MSSIFLFAQDHGKGESSYYQLQNDLHEKLKEISEQIKRDGVSIPDVLRPLTRDSIAQCVISPSHIAFRLEDGQVCRVAYTINSDRLSQKPDRKRKQGMSCSDSSSTVREGVVARTGSTQHGSRSYRSPLNVLGRTSRGISFLREMQRQGIYLARPVTHQIPESEIPEVLIEECQTVLQGKSRQVIVRELQNTNLDVNMAVNNLLSRDDEAEQGNGGNSSDGNAPGAGAGGNSDDWDDEAVELLSFFEYPDSHGLFDADGLIADEMAGPPTSPRFRGDLTSDYEYGFLSDRRKRRRMESHLYNRGNELYSGRNTSVVSDTTYNRSVADSLRNSTVSDSASDNVKQSGSSTRYYVQLCDVLEFWPDPENSELNLHFVHITALHSELVALTTWGELHQWRWGDSTPFFMRNTANLKEDNDKKIIDSESTGHAEHSFSAVYHPRVLDLGLGDEKIIKLSGCATRATVLTATGKFATWMDESLVHSLPASYPLGSLSGSLGIEHQAVLFPELRDETVVEIHTAPLVTVIRCLSGSVYWWGIYPSYMRQRAIEKMRQNRVSSVSKRTNASSKNSGSRRYCLSQQSSSNSTAESSNTSTGEIHGQNVTDISSSSTGIVPGSFVCIRSAPIFHAGAIGFTVVGGVPKVGTLLEDAWKTTDVCRFRINVMNSTSFTSGINEGPFHPPALSSDSSQHILTCPYTLGLTVHNQHSSSQCSASLGNSVSGVQFPSDQIAISSSGSNSTLTFQEMPPPPSPASSTCSDQSGPVRVSPGTFKRKKVPSISGDRSERIVGDWDIGNQNNSRSARGRSADRDPSIGVPVNSANKRGSIDLNHDVIDVTNRSDIGCNRASNNSTFSEEDWCLSDVIFVEDGRTQPVGIVLKVDGNIAAVKFLKEQERSCVAANCPYSPVCVLINSILGVSSSLTATTSTYSQIPLTSADPMSWLNDCRLLRKEDLTIVRNAGLVRVPDVVQRTPRRVFAAPSSNYSRNSGDSRVSKGLPCYAPKILALAVENSRIHVIAEQTDGGPYQSALYQVYNLSGKLIINQRMPVSASALKPVAEVKDGSATITCPSEHPLLLRDPSGLVLPFIPPSRTASHEIWTNLMSVDLPPVQCASFAWIRNHLPPSGISGCTNGRQSSKSQSEQQPRCLFGLVVVQDLTLMPHILRANDVQVEKLLAADLSSVESLKVACEMADGRRNLLHMAVSMCAPQSNKETSPEWLSKLEPILTSPIFRPTFEDKTKPIKEANESSDPSVMKVVNPNTSSRQPSFWSSVARSSTGSGCLSMHELFIRSSIEAATVAAAAALSSSTSRGDSDIRTTSNTAPSSGNGINFWHLPPVRKDELTRRISSYRILRLLVESRHLIPSLIPLLTARNTEDLTPFMLAIKIRAYSVARFLYDTIRCISELPGNSTVDYISDRSALDFFSPASHKLDDSPLFQLCYNDTCTFTWTGPDHIRQDIFECRTCGLTDSLCCCTECARVCHKGHDCRLKRTSPTAYCDCWEKCCCQSLISGFQAPRHELFYKLLSGTKLIHNRNARGEHLLLYLAKCMERQTREQRQHRPSRRRLTSATTRTNSNCNPPVTSASNTTSNWEPNNGAQNSGPEEPDHDLEPPRFARDAFELALDCPAAVHSMLTLDSNSDILDTDSLHQKNGFINEDQVFLSSQGGTNQLDDFVFTLICKCPPEITDILLSTLNRCIVSFPSNTEEKKRKFSDDTLPANTPNNSAFLKQCDYPNSVEMTLAAARFIRSVARIYASLSLELAPDQKKKSRLGLAQPTLLDLCRHVFSSLAPIAINELPVLAASLLVPIRTGTVRPCAPFSFTSQSSEVASGLELLINAERNNFTRQQLLSSSEATKTDDLSNKGIQRSMSIDDGYRHHHSSFNIQPSYRSVSESVTVPSMRHHTVISSLNFDLSSPHVVTSDTLEPDTTKYTHAESNMEVASPTTVTPSIHDPSLLTLQMQSTITDIETSVSEHALTVMTSTADASSASTRLEPNNSSVHFPPVASNVSDGCSLNFVFTPNFSASSCPDSIFQIQSSGESHTSPTYESLDDNVVDNEATARRIGDAKVTHNEAVDSGTWSYPRREEPGYQSHIFPLVPDDNTVNDSRDSEIAFPSGSRRRVTESNNNSFCKRRRTIDPEISSPESKDDTIQIDSHISYPLSPSAQDELPLSLLDTDATVSQTSSTAVTLGSTTDLDIRSELSSNLNVELHPTSSFSTNVVTSELHQCASEVSNHQQEEIGFSRLLNSDVDLYQSSLSIQEGPLPGRTGDAANGPQNNIGFSVSEQSNAFQAEDVSDGQASDYDEYDEQDDGDDGEDHEDDDDENETEDEDGDQDVYGEGDQLIEGEDDEEDEDDEDDSSHHSDESSADAGSRSTSPTWVSWPRTSIFSRLSSRAVSQSSESVATTTNTTDVLNSNRDNTNELNTVTTGQSLTNLTSVTLQGRNTSSLLSGRRSVQSVISLLNTSTSSATPTLVISSTGNVSNTPASSETVVTNATSSVTTPAVSTNVGCIMTTQVYLCRTFACLLRVTADLLSEIQGEFSPFSGPLRRCTSVPTSIGLPLTVYDQQRRLPIYCTSSIVATSTTSANNQPHALVLTPSNTLSSIARPNSSSTEQSSGIRGRLIRSCTTAVSLASGRANAIKVGSDSHCVQLVASVGAALIPVWQWITMAMDNLEAQLRFSASWNAYFPNKNALKSQSKIPENQDGVSSVRDIPVSLSSQVNNETNNRRGHASTFYSRRPAAVANTSSSSTTTNARLSSNDPITVNSSIDSVAVVLGQRQDFLAYLFSIMRTSGGDHGDSVPFIDPQVNKHLAYILDALLYFFRVFESSWPSGITRQLNSTLPDPTVRFKLNDVQQECTEEIAESSTSSVLRTTQLSHEKTPDVKNVFTANQVTQRNDPFFRRSESILSLSGLGPDLLDAPLSESLPLALQPQLLQPTSGRAELFGCDRFLPMMSATHVSSTRKNDHIPIHMNAMSSTWGERICGSNITEIPFINESDNSEFLNPDTQQLLTGAKFLDSVGHSATLLSRWCSALEFFGRHFTPDVGAENGSYIFELGGFSAKEGRFRKQMERLRNVSRKDLVLEVERERGPLILNTIKLLNMEYAKRQSQTPLTTSNGSLYSANNFPLQYTSSSSHQRDSPSTRQNANTNQVAIALLLGTTTDSPLLGTLFGASPVTPTSVTSNSVVSGQQPILSCRRIKVTFKDEPGEGSGVARSFFTAFSEAVLSQEPLPNLNLLLQNNSSNSLGNQQPNFHRHYTVLSRSQSNNSANRPTAVLVQSTTSSIFLSTQSITSSSNNTHSPTLLSSSLNNGLSGHQPVPLTTPTTIQSSISFCPYQIQPRLHTFTIGSRGRSSAWRRSGGLSTNAPPFYPSAAQAAFSSSDLSPAGSNSRTSSRNPSPVRHSDTSNISVGNVSGTEVLSSRVLDSCASLQLLNSNTNISSGSSPNRTQDPSDNISRNILLVNYEPSNSIQSTESNNPVCARHDLANGRSVGGRLFTRIQSLVRNEHLTARITGMLLELPSSEHSVLLTNEEALCNRVDEARALITMSDTNDQNRVERPRTPSIGLNQPVLERLVNWQGVALTVTGATSVNQQSNISSSSTIAELIITEDVERVPLFWQPGLQGYYFPRAVPGINLPSNQTCDSVKLAARYSIYRGIGRVIGLCLLTNETCPLHFSRPVLKYILGRVVHWHDFAFYDPTTFEGLRQLLLHTSEDFSKSQGSIEDYNLTFSLIPALEEGGLSSTDAVRQPNDYLYALIPGGDEVEVNESNVFEFVKKYTEFKMKTAVQEPLEQLRQGVFDVLPRNALDGLTAEDLRLLLNGTGDIDVDVLCGYTTFVDETGTGSNVDVTKSCDNTNLVNRLKKWFWCTVRSMDMKQRQDLLYFWTSSPTLPASAQGFQPMPSITIKPPDDHHLPSANTCISRLYLPLYSSRHILRDKLLQAIGTKSFGFV
ncbi:unnamed protein product [Schistosoma intercalatum]|nr:unnamed protein product [Schistosoma intercalatum]CAH8457766.1 unnamed protein product [Schistosoma intercalatum]